jgi:hypothetical protein
MGDPNKKRRRQQQRQQKQSQRQNKRRQRQSQREAKSRRKGQSRILRSLTGPRNTSYRQLSEKDPGTRKSGKTGGGSGTGTTKPREDELDRSYSASASRPSVTSGTSWEREDKYGKKPGQVTAKRTTEKDTATRPSQMKGKAVNISERATAKQQQQAQSDKTSYQRGVVGSAKVSRERQKRYMEKKDYVAPREMGPNYKNVPEQVVASDRKELKRQKNNDRYDKMMDGGFKDEKNSFSKAEKESRNNPIAPKLDSGPKYNKKKKK